MKTSDSTVDYSVLNISGESVFVHGKVGNECLNITWTKSFCSRDITVRLLMLQPPVLNYFYSRGKGVLIFECGMNKNKFFKPGVASVNST